MEDSNKEVRTAQKRRPMINMNHKLFNDTIKIIKKEGDKMRTVTLNKDVLSSNEAVGKNSQTHPSEKKLLERATVEEGKSVFCQKVNPNSSKIPYKSHERNGNLRRSFHQSSNSGFKDHNYYNKDSVEKKHVETQKKLHTIVNAPEEPKEESEDYIEFKEFTHSRKILSLEDNSLKITMKNVVSQSIPNLVTNIKSPESLLCNLETDQECSNLTKLNSLSSEENYIPPPVGNQDIKKKMNIYNIDASSTDSERSDMYAFRNGNSESLEDSTNSEDEGCISLPDLEQIEAISEFISGIVKEKSVCNVLADRVLQDLNTLLRDQLEGYRVDLYGSYFSDLAISTSDINLVLISDSSIRKSFMIEIYKLLSSDLDRYYVYPYEEGNTAHQIKINFSHPENGVNCQLAYLGKYKAGICQMGRFLKKIGGASKRVKTLIVATKIWSECLCINEVEEGKLHPIGYILMVIHFLQNTECPILPTFPCEAADIEVLPPNNSSIGELWLAFLKYYAFTFNWKRDVITINSKEIVSKKSKGWEAYWIAVEDPYTGKNVAESVVNSDVADYIKICFKSSYEYFCSPPQNNVLYSVDDKSNGDSASSKWNFSFQLCTTEQSDIFCENCDDLMDVCDDCQKKLYVQPMLSVPKLTDSFLELVKESLITVYEKYMLSEEEIEERKIFVQELQAKVRRIHPDAEMNIFGSSANGFGFRNSDVDICLTFKSNKVINTASVLKDVRFLLRKDKDFNDVVAIFNAQIPIVKFHYQPKEWRGDISLSNSLAIHNSHLLYTYSLLDKRCKVLGCALKLLAKKALIAEVTEKALSSYSYLNMVIHFLQQTDPPVLPVLQDNKFRKKDYNLGDIVENCNVWFCKDLDYIRSEFKAENKTPVELLWLELLDYYCSYDSSKFISIRQKDPVLMDEKKHSARLFNIQDPFIETKNLGRVLSTKKAQETKSVFNRARQLFRTPVKELPNCVKDIEDFFFSTQSLTGRIMKEAHCNRCGKFGHERKECKQTHFPFRRNFFQRFSNQITHYRRNPKQWQMNRNPYRSQ